MNKMMTVPFSRKLDTVVATVRSLDSDVEDGKFLFVYINLFYT